MKVFHNGRDITGKFSRETFINKITRKLRVMWYWSKITLGIGFVGAIIGGAIVGATVTSTASYARAVEVVIEKVDSMPEKIEKLKQEVLAKLTDCESNGYTEDQAIVIIDNNEKGTLKGDDILSYGLLQWKTDTVIGEVLARDGVKLTPKEAKELAWDLKRAQELASFTIFKNKGKGVGHWANCARKHGLYEEVAFIKKLETQ